MYCFAVSFIIQSLFACTWRYRYSYLSSNMFPIVSSSQNIWYKQLVKQYTCTCNYTCTCMYMYFSQMCEVLGIVEIDYFGLKFADRVAGCEAWINTRSNLRRQLKRCRLPYRLGFRVKYFTEPNLLQQPSTRFVCMHLYIHEHVHCMYNVQVHVHV